LTDEQKEIAQLKKQLRDISEEHEILKKVTSIFSMSDKLSFIKYHKFKFPVV